MEQKTKVNAPENQQEIFITREFDLPLELLFKAYEEPEIVEQWMGTKVIRMENKKFGGYEFETSHNGKVVFRANGTIHEFIPNEKIVRTFEMENSPLPVQLEYLHFEKLTDETSKLTMQVIFKSLESRNQLLKMPFAKGISMAHDRLEQVVNNIK